jgi:PKD repeat protein
MKLLFKCRLIICLTFEIVIGSLVANAQISEPGIPESFRIEQKKAIVIPTLTLDSIDAQKMLEDDKKFGIDNRYGVVQQCDVNIREAGVKTEIAGKGTIWRYEIVSKDAYSLGILFKTYHLPKGASVFIYDTSKTRLRGAFTHRNNNSGDQLPVAEFPGKNLIIEYFEPVSAEFAGELVVGSVSQAYTNFESSATTRIGINCPQGDNWKVEKTCVCLMTFNDSRYSYFCSGALINNVKQDETPYFLTANHCISTESVANTLVTYFNYENSTCSSNDASKRQSLAGATFKSGSSYSDFSLLLLKEYPPTEYNPFYAGWDATGNAPSSEVGIHHPQGTPKCIAIDSNPATNYPYSVQWKDNNGTVISSTSANTHWEVQFDQGATEEGSSGSPLFDQNKRIVGQLHGGTNPSALYGKFSLSWNYNSSFDKQLAHWLDPGNTTKILDGTGKLAPIANFHAQIQQVCANNPVVFSDESTHNPTAWLWKISPSSYRYANGTDSTSQNPQISFLKDGYYSVTLFASNSYGINEMIQENYIQAKSKLDVKFLLAHRDSVVCGCNLNSFPLVATGAFLYNFKVDQPGMIDTKVSSDTLFMTLNSSANGASSFDTWVKVSGTFGACTASDSILLHVIIQPNDNIAHAARLSLGRNTGFSNQCATVQKNEAFPSSSGCDVANNWCPDTTGSKSVLNNTIWFTFVYPSSGWVTISTSGFDDQIALYQASSINSIMSGYSNQYKMLAANDNRSASDKTALIENLKLEPEKQYWLQVDGNNAAYGNLVVDILSNSLEVYPNPSSGVFNLIVSNPVEGNAEVSIFDLNGRKLLSKLENVGINSNKFTIDLSSLRKGIYLLNVRMNGSNLSKKLVLF